MKQLILTLSFLFPPFVALAQEPPLAFETASRKFSNIVNYSVGRARIRLYGANGYGYMDTAGQVVIRPQFEEAESFQNGLAAVGKTINGKFYKNDAWGFMDAAGKMVIAPQFNEVTLFSEGRAIAVSKEGKLLVIKKPVHP